MTGRNEKCPCGSEKKYKKCCLMNEPYEVPREVVEHFQRVRAEQEYLKERGVHINYVRPVPFQGKMVWALKNKVYMTGLNETFHTFLLNRLVEVLGQEWWSTQSKLPEGEKHFIALCLDKLNEWFDRSQKIAEPVPEKPGVWGAKPDGYGKSMLSLAFDVCSLIHTDKLPDTLLERLKSRDQYQGARYEIAIAAIFARLGCDIQFTDEQSKSKHCEFVATHQATGAKLAVEAKSKHRSGVLHQIGLLAPIEKLLSIRTVRRLFNDALEQNPKDVPFAIFIDVNAPHTPGIPADEKQWVKDAKALVDGKLSKITPQEYPLNAVFFTNFSYHYQTESEAEPVEVLGRILDHPKFSPLDPQFFSSLQKALSHYGFVPPIDLLTK